MARGGVRHVPALAAAPERPSTALVALLIDTGAGDHEAFARLYDEVAPRAYGVVLRTLSQRDLADAVLHQVFLEVWRSAAQFDPTVEDATTWVLRIANRRAVACLRDHLPTGPRVLSADAAMDPVDASAGPPKGRPALSDDTLLARIYFDGYSYTDISSLHEVPIGEVKAAARAALTQQRGVRRG